MSQIDAIRDAEGVAVIVRESNLGDLLEIFKRIDERIEELFVFGDA
jgi:hypothetical protein